MHPARCLDVRVGARVSGHASREEMKLMINLVKRRYLVQLNGELRHLKLHAEMGVELGIPKNRVAVIENGTPIDLTRIIKVNKPMQRVRYELQEIGQPTLEDVLKDKCGR